MLSGVNPEFFFPCHVLDQVSELSARRWMAQTHMDLTRAAGMPRTLGTDSPQGGTSRGVSLRPSESAETL